MSTFVLVHGAWHGGWCWRAVARELTIAGHDVFTPTLTGLSDRAHLLNRSVGLETHVTDLVALLAAERLEPVILVGHSYGGMVVTAVADEHPEFVKKLVVIDGFVPERGESAMQLLPERASTRYRQLAHDDGDGWLIPIRSVKGFGVVDDALAELITERLTDQPLKCFEDLSPGDASRIRLPAFFFLCTEWSRPFAVSADRARAYGWTVREIPADHEVMITSSGLLTQLLVSGL